MQLSYNVIKNGIVKNNGLKEIITEAEKMEVKASSDITYKSSMDSYENLARTILENARIQKEQILAKAYEEARIIQDEALRNAEQISNEAFQRGFSQGQEAGYSEALLAAEKEKDLIILSAEELLMNAKAEYENYFESKKDEILDLVVSTAEVVIKKELNDKSSINSMIYEALEVSKNAKNFIIRCNEIYVEELKTKIECWKEQLGFKGDIFIVKDNSIEIGNAIIDKGNGKLVVGIDYALQRVKELLEGKE